MTIRTVAEYWGFTPQKFAQWACEHSPKAVRFNNANKGYLVIKACAKSEDTEAYWENEKGARNDRYHERADTPKGKTPIVRFKAIPKSVNMMSTFTVQEKIKKRP